MNATTQYFVREALRQAWRQRFLTTVAACALALAAVFGGAWGLLWRNAQHWQGQIGQAAQLDVFLKMGLSPLAQDRALGQARALSGVAQVDLITPEDAARSLAEDPQLRQALDLLGENPFPPRLRVLLESLDPSAAARVALSLQALEGVESLEDGGDAVQRLLKASRALRSVLLGLGLLFSGAALAIVAAVLRLAAWSQRRELGIMKLVGASHAFIRAPFLLAGMLQGLLGGVFAVLALRLTLAAVATSLGEGLGLSLSEVLPVGLDLPLAASLVLSCGLLGLLGAWLALATLTLAYEDEEQEP